MNPLSKFLAFLDEKDDSKSWRVGSFTFLRILGILFLVAFWDLWEQILPLVGEAGLSPYQNAVNEVEVRFAEIRLDRMPTIFWFFDQDWILLAVCISGMVISSLLAFGVLQGPANVILWILYLSMVNVGGPFLSASSDLLLLEASFLSILIAPWKLYTPWRKWSQTTRIARWLFRWLLFRYIFESGMIKITSEDPIWYPQWMGMYYFYFTQSIPNWIAWYFHHLPISLNKMITFSIVGIQLILSFCILGVGFYRWLAFFIFVLLHSFFFVVGASGIEHLLVISLTLFLIEDKAVKKMLGINTPDSNFMPKRAVRYVQITVAFFFFLLIFPGSIINLAKTFYPQWVVPHRIYSLYETQIAPFRIINTYTQSGMVQSERQEIILLGSNDGELWKEYELNSKPGGIYRRPYFLFFHFPRLDWQFSKLSYRNWYENDWLIHLMDQLLKGNNPASKFLSHNPFEEAPPKYIKASSRKYQFSGADSKRHYGHWWYRSSDYPYSPVMSLD